MKFPKVLGSILALFVIALCFAVSYGQQRIQVCENGQCRIVELQPQAKVDPPIDQEIYFEPVPSFPSETRWTQTQRNTSQRTGFFQRLFRPLRALRCRR